MLGIGTWTLLDRSAFPDATVWSDYGMGYLFIPVFLPVTGLIWLRRARYGVARLSRPVAPTDAGKGGRATARAPPRPCHASSATPLAHGRRPTAAILRRQLLLQRDQAQPAG